MRPDAWADGAAALQRAVLAELELADPVSFSRIRQALDDGGRLKIVLDAPDGVWRLRVRLVHAPGSAQVNRWIWQSYARRPPWLPLVVVE